MPLNVLIVGAGTGGPAVAIALARKGHKVTVLERVESTTEIGFAFRITPSSNRCLSYLGIDTAAGGAVAANGMRLLDSSGKLLAEVKENTDDEQSKQGVSVFAFRPSLGAQLHDRASQLGVDIKTGLKVESVDTDSTELTLKDGSKLSADLVVGCDGIHSVVRPQVFDTSIHFPKPSSDDNCLRFMLDASTVAADEGLSQLINDNYRMASWHDNTSRSRILVYPVNSGKQYNLVCTHPQHKSEDELAKQAQSGSRETTYDKRISLEAALDIYSDFEPRARRLIELADPNGFRVWKLQDIDEAPRWSVNRTVLLGDAAHAVLPFGFSGAGMAIEDSVVLAELLDETVRIGDIPTRLAKFEEVRKPRVARVRETSREIAKGKEDAGYVEEYFKFLSNYDAVEEGRRGLAELAE